MREDERLMNSTIIQHDVQTDLRAREEKVRQSKVKVEALQAAKRESRRNNLHTLYMNARSFIVTEEVWNAKVEEVFDEPYFKNNPTASIWDKEGIPESINSILVNSDQKTKAVAANTGYLPVTTERLQRIAEGFTGGKM